jgi:hypothetical protein
MANMRPRPKFMLAGFDVTSLQLEEPMLRSIFRNETRPMAAAGAGVAVELGPHVTFDVGYRYSAILIDRQYLQDYAVSPHSHYRIDVHRTQFGVGFAF